MYARTVARVSGWVVVVREQFFLVTSAICVRIRGHKDCLPHDSRFLSTAAFSPQWIRRDYLTLFCYVNIKLFFVWFRMLVWDCNAGCFCWFYCCFSFTVQPYWVHPKSKCWTVAVQLTEVTSCHRVCLCLFCQFYEHSTYLTSDATKDWIVKFVAGWTFSSDFRVWRGGCLGSELYDFGSVMLETCTQA